MAYEFRTVNNYDCVKDADAEVFTEPSLTDDSEYESLEQLLARCLRGDFSKCTNISGGFDEDVPDDEVLDSLQPQDGYNFDISDKTEIEYQAQQSLKKANLEKKDAQASVKVASPKKTSENLQSEAKQSEEVQA